MTKRLDALAIREYTDNSGEKRTAFTRIGVAFETRNGGWSVLLDAIPAPTEGQFKILLTEPRPRDAQHTPSGGSYDERNPPPPDSDEIPF